MARALHSESSHGLAGASPTKPKWSPARYCVFDASMDGLLASIVLTPLLAQVGIGLKIALYDPVAPADVSCHSVKSHHHHSTIAVMYLS